tara:strand:+ start:212 stop:610 length:399 start_codon:yes stop_codon:yes gene_type:complete
MKLIGKKLVINEDYAQYICEVSRFMPATKPGQADLYRVTLPYVGTIDLQESQISVLFKILEPKTKADTKDIKVDTPDLKKRRAALKAQKKDALLKTVANMSLEDEIASSLKKDLLVEEILKEEFKESYEAEG